MEKKIDENNILGDEQLDSVAGGSAGDYKAMPYRCTRCGREAWSSNSYRPGRCPDCGGPMMPLEIKTADPAIAHPITE